MAVIWCFRAFGRVRRQTGRGNLTAVGHGFVAPAVPSAPRMGPRSQRLCFTYLSLRHATCLERALVRRAMLAGAGITRPVVVGVARDGTNGIKAHAWIDGDPEESTRDYQELLRIEA